MKPLTLAGILLCILCQAAMVTGQLLLKRSIGSSERRPTRRRQLRNFAAGIGCLTLWFFIWLGLLSQWDISKLYPFEGLNPAIMAIAAWLLLKEKLTISAWFGLVLVCVGIAVVSAS